MNFENKSIKIVLFYTPNFLHLENLKQHIYGCLVPVSCWVFSIKSFQFLLVGRNFQKSGKLLLVTEFPTCEFRQQNETRCLINCPRHTDLTYSSPRPCECANYRGPHGLLSLVTEWPSRHQYSEWIWHFLVQMEKREKFHVGNLVKPTINCEWCKLNIHDQYLLSIFVS